MWLPEQFEKSSMFHWFPILEGLAAEGRINVPETVLVRFSERDAACRILDGDRAAFDRLVRTLKKAAEGIGYPLFLRTDQLSGKHSFKRTCFVPSFDKLAEHVFALIDENLAVDVPVNGFALRRYIEPEYAFTAFYGLPVARERRYFIQTAMRQFISTL